MELFTQILSFLIFFLIFFSIITIFANPVINIFDNNIPTKSDRMFFSLGLLSAILCVFLVYLDNEISFNYSGIPDSLYIIEDSLNSDKMDLRNLDILFKNAVHRTNGSVTVREVGFVSYDKNYYEVTIVYIHNYKKWFSFLVNGKDISFTYKYKVPKQE